MRILFALSQTQITGAETYALSLAKALRILDHEVLFVSDELHESHPFKFYPLSIHGKNHSYLGRIQNVFSLRKIMRAEKIGLIHSHSRAANLISHLATRAFPTGRIPHVTTVHGRWRNTFAFRNFPCLGDRAIAVCPYLERYLCEDIGFPKDRIVMIPNPVDTDRFSPQIRHSRESGNLSDRPAMIDSGSRPSGLAGMTKRSSQSPIILYVGRFSGQKGNVLRFILKKVIGDVLNLIPEASLKILAADQPSKADLEIVDGLNGGMGFVKAVEILPGTPLLPDLYRSSTVAIGAGRVALEALACGIPVVAIGESSAPGLLEPESFEKAFDSNFGDCGEWDLFKSDASRMVADLQRILGDSGIRRKLSDWGRNLILSRFDAAVVARDAAGIYEKAVR